MGGKVPFRARRRQRFFWGRESLITLKHASIEHRHDHHSKRITSRPSELGIESVFGKLEGANGANYVASSLLDALHEVMSMMLICGKLQGVGGRSAGKKKSLLCSIASSVKSFQDDHRDAPLPKQRMHPLSDSTG